MTKFIKSWDAVNDTSRLVPLEEEVLELRVNLEIMKTRYEALRSAITELGFQRFPIAPEKVAVLRSEVKAHLKNNIVEIKDAS